MNICDMCKQECNLGGCGNAIAVQFPYGHKLDTLNTHGLDGFDRFCSSECLINYIVLHEHTPDEVKDKMKGDDQ